MNKEELVAFAEARKMMLTMLTKVVQIGGSEFVYYRIIYAKRQTPRLNEAAIQAGRDY